MARKDRGMSITRKVQPVPKKRLQSELHRKAERIGALLGMEGVPTHTLAWKELRLETRTGDCYPVYDVLERVAEKIARIELSARLNAEPDEDKKPKKPGRPAKKDA